VSSAEDRRLAKWSAFLRRFAATITVMGMYQAASTDFTSTRHSLGVLGGIVKQSVSAGPMTFSYLRARDLPW